MRNVEAVVGFSNGVKRDVPRTVVINQLVKGTNHEQYRMLLFRVEVHH